MNLLLVYLIPVFLIPVFLLIAGICVKVYLKLTTGWCESHACLVGKTAIITGANTGIGLEAALDFAQRGARVILACRNLDKGKQACDKIIEETGNKNVVLKSVDLSSFDSVRNFAADINTTEERLDILVNNAGALGTTQEKTKDGYLVTMQVNYFSSFLLTNLLTGLMKKSGSSRIVNVSSIAAKYVGNFDLSTLDTDNLSYLNVYAASKLCNILFTIELAKRLQGTGVTTYSLHPGVIKTELYRYQEGLTGKFLRWMLDLFYKTIREGAQTTIYCSVARGIEKYNGGHFSECKKVESYATATVPGLSGQLWELSEKIVQLNSQEDSV